MALNRITKKFTVSAAANTWVQVPVSLTGKLFLVRTTTPASVRAPQDPIEIALSVAAPAGAGTPLPSVEATECQIQNASTATLWVRRTAAAVPGGVKLDIDPLLNGNVLTATA